MFKPIERMHLRSKLVQVGATCMGQQLVAAYRTLKDEDTGDTICMIMRWSSPGSSDVGFLVQKNDELMHLWFEDNGCDWSRERYLEEHGNVTLSKEVTDSAVYKRVYDQLLRGISKKIREVEAHR